MRVTTFRVPRPAHSQAHSNLPATHDGAYNFTSFRAHVAAGDGPPNNTRTTNFYATSNRSGPGVRLPRCKHCKAWLPRLPRGGVGWELAASTIFLSYLRNSCEKGTFRHDPTIVNVLSGHFIMDVFILYEDPESKKFSISKS